MATLYELRKNEIEVKNEKEIYEGCSTEQQVQEPAIIKSFESEKEALEELKRYNTDIRNMGSYLLVTEFYVEENTYDEDGEWVSGGEICGFSKNK